MIQAIFFDLGDTLVHIRPAVLAQICNRISEIRGIPISLDDYLSTFLGEWNNRSNSQSTAKVKGIKDNADESERQYWKNFFESIFPALGLIVRPADLIDWLVDLYTSPFSFECFDDAESVLIELQRRGLVLGIISNAFPSADKILDYLNLRQHFKYLFLSFELPYAKPEIEIYKFSAEKVGIPIEDILFIDDRWNFVRGAQEAKMNALLIDREEGSRKDIKTTSLVRRIKSLKELLNMVELSQNKFQSASTQKEYGTGDDNQNLCRISKQSTTRMSMLYQ